MTASIIIVMAVFYRIAEWLRSPEMWKWYNQKRLDIKQNERVKMEYQFLLLNLYKLRHHS